MAHPDRKPPVALEVDRDFFNVLIQVLVQNEKVTVDDTHKIAKELKEKLLRYSVPYMDRERGGKYYDMVSIRFFPKEASEMLWQLALGYIEIKPKADYYSVLVKVRETMSRNKKEE